MKNFDCGFTRENNRFRYRAAAIIIEDKHVLFAGNELDDYYYSIGGAVHIGETAEDAVKREVYEETGVSYEIDHLAVIHENFFNENNGTSAGLKCHEICLYFLMKPRGTMELHSNSTTRGVKENMYWLPIKDLDKYRAFPSFMKDYLSREHNGIEHIVSDERKGNMISRLDFILKKSKYSSSYEYNTEEFKVEISEEYFDDNVIEFMNKFVELYTVKVREIAKACIRLEWFNDWFQGETVESIVSKLGRPIFRFLPINTIITYAQHELDEDHIIDVEVIGMYEEFDVSIDG